ncbi:hypothetical protein [Levilactobacillus spicheri]|uniref:Uncharacterized protein n=1 Tax=Levilactobacillus spicheri TaxID=216463 RepID=A0A0F3RY38_9LACO|nr:hypothetical protein [Levilactobacillus spicheri]KJW13732.1 hypothetical protein VC81_00655 [Levilactobacillus spicheri]
MTPNLAMLCLFVVILFVQKGVAPRLRVKWGVAVLPTLVLLGGGTYVLLSQAPVLTLLWSLTLVTVLAVIVLLMGATVQR